MAADAGLNLHGFSEDGTKLSIYDSDGSVWFAELAERATGPSILTLSIEPVEDTLVVRFEGRTWIDGTYDASTRSVTVSGVEPEQDGAEVVTTYDRACG